MNASSLRIVIPGGSGQIGTMLARAFHARGHRVTVLTRRPTRQLPWHCVHWDGHSQGKWQDELEGADAVINLCGRSVNCRYTRRNRRAIWESRVRPTRLVGEAIASAAQPPRVWLQASTATIYAHTFGTPNDEFSGPLGGDEPEAPETWRFSIDVARAWERAAEDFSLPATRLVLLRSAMTMSPDRGGIFDVLLRLVRFGLGGCARVRVSSSFHGSTRRTSWPQCCG